MDTVTGDASGDVPAFGAARAAAPVAARTRSVLDGLAPIAVPRAVVEASADVLCALADSAPDELGQVARELAARLRDAAHSG